jgi:hypothetical protein
MRIGFDGNACPRLKPLAAARIKATSIFIVGPFP